MGAMGVKKLKVAAVQLAAQTIDAAEGVWPRIERWVREAAGAGCGLVVVPECSYPAYVLGSAERARGGDILGRTAIVERFATIARENRITLVAGFAEDFDGKLWNSAGVWDSTGRLLGVQRKTFLFDCDNKWFSHGTSIEPIATEHGRIGIVICADARAPEVSATLVNRGAELIVVPTAWVNMAKGAGEYWNVQPDCLIRARAMEFGVAYVCADKCGAEPPLTYVGFSQVVDAGGGVLAKAGPVEEGAAIADVEIHRGRTAAVPAKSLEALRGGYARNAGATARDAIAYLTHDEARTFHAARVAGLRGTRVVEFPEVGDVDAAVLRTRAAENRVFVRAIRDGKPWMTGPDGRVIEGGSERAIDPTMADDKHVTPLTDIFEQRRPELYQFELS